MSISYLNSNHRLATAINFSQNNEFYCMIFQIFLTNSNKQILISESGDSLSTLNYEPPCPIFHSLIIKFISIIIYESSHTTILLDS